jgi:nucleotide-binding universal stress UspA family protein
MIEHVFVPVDGSDAADRAVDLASEIAGRLGAKLTLLHVLRDPGTLRVPEEFRELSRDEHIEVTERDLARSAANEIVAKARQRAHDQGAKDIETAVEIGDPGNTVVEYAARQGVDLIVIGSRGRGDVRGLLFGSVSHKVTHLAECPCLIVK